jgi:hypothetical protein
LRKINRRAAWANGAGDAAALQIGENFARSGRSVLTHVTEDFLDGFRAGGEWFEGVEVAAVSPADCLGKAAERRRFAGEQTARGVVVRMIPAVAHGVR